jgi:hypothetical protein
VTPRIRAAVDTDLPLIFATWLKGARTSRIAYGVPGRAYHPGQREVVEGLLAEHGALVACDPEDEDVIWGWCCVGGEPCRALHWIFVKYYLRGAGVARALLEAAGLDRGTLVCTHWTRDLDRFHGRVAEYDPYLLTRFHAHH